MFFPIFWYHLCVWVTSAEHNQDQINWKKLKKDSELENVFFERH